MKELEDKIREALPRLQQIEKGQRFKSPYYGVITATRVTDWGKGVYSIYGFDEMEGLPRDCYYPRDLELLGQSIKLNDVLEYFNKSEYINGTNMMLRERYAYGIYYILDKWNLSSIFLTYQSEELINFLNEL